MDNSLCYFISRTICLLIFQGFAETVDDYLQFFYIGSKCFKSSIFYNSLYKSFTIDCIFILWNSLNSNKAVSTLFLHSLPQVSLTLYLFSKKLYHHIENNNLHCHQRPNLRSANAAHLHKHGQCRLPGHADWQKTKNLHRIIRTELSTEKIELLFLQRKIILR